MKLSLELILERLMEVHVPVVFMGGVEVVSLSGAVLFSTATPPSDKELMHVGLLSDLLALNPYLTEDYVFCVFGNQEEFAKAQQTRRCTMFYFMQNVDMAWCVNLLQGLFARFQQWDLEMDKILVGKGSIQDFVDLAKPFLENPIYIWDAAYRIQAMTNIAHADHPLLSAYEESGSVPPHLLNQLSQTRDGLIYNATLYTTMQIIYPPNLANIPFALKVFMSGQKTVLVLVSYFINTSPTKGQVEILQMLASKLELYAAENFPKSHMKPLLYEPFVIELVEGTLQTEEEIRGRLNLLKLPYQMKYRIYFIVEPSRTTSLINYLRHNCKVYLPYARVIPYKQGILVLDQEGKESLESDEVKTRFESGRAALARINAVCGISSSFFNLSQTRIAYLQAIAAFELGCAIDPGQVVYYYRDYYLYHMLDTFSKYPEMKLGQLYFSRLDMLEKNDQDTKNDNMRLLEIYLRNNRNITNTANEMHLHRNSIIYRLERISELLRVPLDNPDVQMRLLISFRIRRLHSIHRGIL